LNPFGNGSVEEAESETAPAPGVGRFTAAIAAWDNHPSVVELAEMYAGNFPCRINFAADAFTLSFL
jgi:hypothetical protein